MNRSIRYLILTAAIVFTLPTLGTAQEPIEDRVDQSPQANDSYELLPPNSPHDGRPWGAYHAGKGGVQFVNWRRGFATYDWKGRYRNVELIRDFDTFDRKYFHYRELAHPSYPKHPPHRWAIPRRCIGGCYHIWFRPSGGTWMMFNVTGRKFVLFP